MYSLYEKLGIRIPTVLMPGKENNMEKWAVVACDQYSSQPEYWQKADQIVGESPSTLKLILPEVYLGKAEESNKINEINKNMIEYVENGVLEEQNPGFILIDRKTSHAESRKGLIVLMDLEKYNYNEGSQSQIRATERTDVNRLPPRIKIRQNASLELPHIMVLIDDPDKTVIEPLFDMKDKLTCLYDFELMLSGGHIKGYKIENKEITDNILSAIEKLADPEDFKKRYGVGDEKGVLLFAVGDGNHSLASAKAHWENVKKSCTEEEKESHPARFALVELVNVHDEGIKFEPIHRVVFNIGLDDFVGKMQNFYGESAKIELIKCSSKHDMKVKLDSMPKDKGVHNLPLIAGTCFAIIKVECPKCNLEVGTLQLFLDQLIVDDKNVEIDYIHGEEVVDSLGGKSGNIGFYLPVMDKNDLYKTVVLDGVLPKKTFSMGEAEEKRFYLECRKIV
ncbi:DUF1015 domain-containing protein [Pseudobacteroides cellulosolvens]|uniref:Putative conserved protein UCP033563 n=1 Tax=Pseudobacteroides cellulosolvens ATCC 35603 = DSM 2933 TaxID=398512 RepID=A0A0L6JS68_9FIRM|nr:DUF1015 domain-containing protein [Pseudobacteroides cellulosolvens]KNY28232.1 putative conserved protein UCP033563 [Pseudobacteroides cellulosolvens ATCC 35603 = DSM 2933]